MFCSLTLVTVCSNFCEPYLSFIAEGLLGLLGCVRAL